MRTHPKSSPVLVAFKAAGGLFALGGLVLLVLSFFIGDLLFSSLWAIEPLAYVGGALVIGGLVIVSVSYVVPGLATGRGSQVIVGGGEGRRWGQVTQSYFDLFHHDLGRPLRRILGKEREMRALLESSAEVDRPRLRELLDEIEGQAPNFRLMMSNIQILVQLEEPDTALELQPVEPSEVVRRIVDRYSAIADGAGKKITWWAEPSEFGIVYSDSSAIEHIVTNLVDNSIRFSTDQVEVKLTRNPSHFFIRVWDDGPGIPAQYLPHIFDRGWTPEVARREEKSSSGIGLFIAKTLGERFGGDLTVESVAAPSENHHTTFLLSLPMGRAG